MWTVQIRNFFWFVFSRIWTRGVPLPTSGQCSLSLPFKDYVKRFPDCFQGIHKKNIDLKWVRKLKTFEFSLRRVKSLTIFIVSDYAEQAFPFSKTSTDSKCMSHTSVTFKALKFWFPTKFYFLFKIIQILPSGLLRKTFLRRNNRHYNSAKTLIIPSLKWCEVIVLHTK